MYTQKLPNLERQRRRQVIVITIGIGLFTAALAGAAIYFLYQTSHLRM
jgi:branched-subunit amino acid ABC-type transport system permease component